MQRSAAEEAKAVPMLLRHAPGIVLPNRLSIVSDAAVQQLYEAGVQCPVLSREANAAPLEGVGSGARI